MSLLLLLGGGGSIGDLAGASAISLSASGVAKGAGALQAATTITVSATSVLKGVGAAYGTSGVTITPTGVLKGTGRLIGSTGVTLTLVGTTASIGYLIGATSITVTPTGVLKGTGRLDGSSSASLSLSGVVKGHGSLLGLSSVTLAPYGILKGSGGLSGLTLISLSASGFLSGGNGALFIILAEENTMSESTAVIGSVNQSITIRIIGTTGAPLESVTYQTSGLSLWMWRAGSAPVAITPADLASLSAGHTDGGIKHVDDGYYRLDVPDAAFVAGAPSVQIGGTVTGGTIIGKEIRLVERDTERVFEAIYTS